MNRKIASLLLAMALALIVLVPAGRVVAATTVLNGVITSESDVPLSEDAVAVITIVDQTATPEAGAIIGEQRSTRPARCRSRSRSSTMTRGSIPSTRTLSSLPSSMVIRNGTRPFRCR